MRTFVLGDSHGGYRAFIQCLERSGFDKENDELICLGDVADGWPDTKKLIEELLTIKHLVMIIGNHDYWFLSWINSGDTPDIWTSQGGAATLASYDNNQDNVPDSHKQLLRNANVVCVDEKKRLFVHGGIDPNQKDLEKQNQHFMMWDRDLLEFARFKNNQKPDFKYGGFEEIYIGHTTIFETFGLEKPTKFCNVWAMDTGGGWGGKLSMMNIDTKEVFQSDFVKTLYPECKGR